MPTDYDKELNKLGLSQPELEKFLREQDRYKTTAQKARRRVRSLKGASATYTPAYDSAGLYHYVSVTGKTPQQAIKDIQLSQATEKHHVEAGGSTQVNNIISGAVSNALDIGTDEIPDIVEKIEGKISNEDLARLSDLQNRLWQYIDFLEEVTAGNVKTWVSMSTVDNRINEIKAEIQEIIYRYLD